MPSLDDLKSEPAIKQRPKRTGFIPSIKQGAEAEDPVVNNMPTITQGNSTIINHKGVQKPASNSTPASKTPESVKKRPIHPRAISLTSNPKNRKRADFSDLPPEQENTGNLNIKKAESLEAEIFAPGGPFEQMRNEELENYKRDMAKWQAEQQMGNNPSAMQAPNSNVVDFPQESDSVASNNIDNIDIFGDDTESGMDYLKEDTEEPEDNQEQSEDDNEESDEESSDDRDLNDLDDDEVPEGYADETPVDDNEYEENETEDDIPQEESDDFPPINNYIDGQIVDLENSNQDTEDDINYNNATEELVDETPEEEEQDNTVEGNDSDIAQFINSPNQKIKEEVDNDDIIAEVPTDTNKEPEKKEDNPIEDKQNLEALRALIRERLAPVTKKLDISSYTIASRGITTENVFGNIYSHVAKWVLPTTGIVVEMKEISGANVELIREHLRRNDDRGALEIIYNHIVSKKPDNFETWMRSIAYADYDHLFMALYIASFNGANYIPVNRCVNPNCKKPYVSENVSMSKVVYFRDKDAEKEFKKIYSSNRTESKGLVVSEIIPISDRFAIGFTIPSLYSVIVEGRNYSTDLVNKYERTVGYLPYIDNIYYIDSQRHQLAPILYQIFDNDPSKTIESKVKRYDKVLNTLSIDQRSFIEAYISKIDSNVDMVGYQIPETTCPYCGTKNPAIRDNIAASRLVFTRSQLAALAIS